MKILIQAKDFEKKLEMIYNIKFIRFPCNLGSSITELFNILSLIQKYMLCESPPILLHDFHGEQLVLKRPHACLALCCKEGKGSVRGPFKEFTIYRGNNMNQVPGSAGEWKEAQLSQEI